MLPFLVGIGIRRFSVEARAIPAVHETLSGLDTADCATLSNRLLVMGRIAEVEAALKSG